MAIKKKYTQRELDELDFMNNWCRFIASYFEELGDNDNEAWNIEVDKSYQAGYVAGFREGYNDMNIEAIETLSADQLAELNRRLKAKFGKTLWDVNKKMETKITNIAKRGTLRNDEEFYLVRNYIYTIADVADKAALCAVLEKITEEYEMAKS